MYNVRLEMIDSQVKKYLEFGTPIPGLNKDAEDILRFIKRDIEYIQNHFGVDVIEYFVIILTTMAFRIVRSSLVGGLSKKLQRCFLDELASIEIQIYIDDEIEIVPMEEADINFSRDDFVRRMELYGLAEGSVLNNSGLSLANSYVDAIFDRPYVGCEEEIMNIICKSQRYICAVFDHIELVGSQELLRNIDSAFERELSYFKRVIRQKRMALEKVGKKNEK